MSKLKILMICAALILLGGKAHAAEYTAVGRNIDWVLVDPTFYYVATTTVTGWGPAGCPTVAFLIIYRAEPDARELLTVILTAKASGRPLVAYGTCSTANPESFFYTNVLQIF